MADQRSTADGPENGRSRVQEGRQVPVFEAVRIDVEPFFDYGNVLDSEIWHWMGHPETLGRYDIDTQEGDQALPPALRSAMHGQSVRTGEEVRKPATLTRDGERYVGVRCVSGFYEPPESFAAECRAAITDERAEELRALLENQAKAGIERLAGTDRIAGAAMVTGIGEGEGAVVRVDFAAFGAEGKNGLKCPYDHRKARNFEAAVAKVSEHLGKTFRDAEKSAEVDAPGVEAPAVAAPVFQAPGVEATAVEPSAFQAPRVEPPAFQAPAFVVPELGVWPDPAPATVPDNVRLPGLLSTLVPDSLGDNIGVIGVNAAENIRRRAEKKAKQHKLDRLPEEALRGMLADENPFGTMPGGPGPDGEALTRWWADNSDRILLTTAVEATLTAKVEKEFADLANREVARRGELSPNPLEAVRKARGKKFAAEAGRRAAARTGELATMPEKERMARTRELHVRIKGAGLEGADLEDVAESVALQHLRNAHNEHEAQLIEQEARQPEQAVTREPELGAAAGLG